MIIFIDLGSFINEFEFFFKNVFFTIKYIYLKIIL